MAFHQKEGDNVEAVESGPPSASVRLALDDSLGLDTCYEYTYRALYPDGGIDWLGNGGTNGVVEVRLAAAAEEREAHSLDGESWERQAEGDWVLKASEGAVVVKGLVNHQLQPDEHKAPEKAIEKEEEEEADRGDQHSLLSSLPTTSSLLSSTSSTDTTETSTTSLPQSSSNPSFATDASPIGPIKSTSSHIPNQSSISSSVTFQSDREEASSGSHSPGATTPATSLPTSPAMGMERDLLGPGGSFGGVTEPLPVGLKEETEGDDAATIMSAAGGAAAEGGEEEKKEEAIERAIESTAQEPIITGPSSLQDDASTLEAISQSEASAPVVIEKDQTVTDAVSSSTSDVEAISAEIIDKLPSIPSLPKIEDTVAPIVAATVSSSTEQQTGGIDDDTTSSKAGTDEDDSAPGGGGGGGLAGIFWSIWNLFLNLFGLGAAQEDEAGKKKGMDDDDEVTTDEVVSFPS
jgi:hypothetical protein